MAEVVAGAVLAEEAVSTTVEAAAVAGIAVAQPTIPLKCSLTQIATSEASESPESLSRSHHTLSIISGHAYVFGGMVTFHTLAGSEMHILRLDTGISTTGSADPQYHCVPALAKRDKDPIPSPRAAHSATVVNGRIYVYGGYVDPHSETHADDSGTRFWEFNPATRFWTCLDPANSVTPSRHSHAAAAWKGKIIIHGGQRSQEGPLSDTWLFDPKKTTWTALPELPSQKAADDDEIPGTPLIAVADSKLYIITGRNDLSSEIHMLDLDVGEKHRRAWTTITYPTNPITPGPRPRTGAGLLPIKTGMGRTYLLLVLGSKKAALDPSDIGDGAEDKPELWSGIWALQLPSSEKTAAQAKDIVRDKLGAATHESEWSEVVVKPVTETSGDSGKSHPGPRGYFGCDLLGDTKVVIWGGINPKGETSGDGWLVDIDAPKPTSLLPWNWWFKREA